jgi:hypothetical protein
MEQGAIGRSAVELMRTLIVSTLLASSMAAADWKPLLNGKNLDGWEVIGDGQWTVMADGTLLGQRIGDYRKMLAPGGPLPTPQQFKGWIDTQSWLYTKREDFGEFDLHLEYCDYKRTPSKIGYEIQINNRFPDPHPSGSIYGFMDAPKDSQREDDWNTMEISSRNQKIAVTLTGRVVAESAGDPQRSKVGPIGLQLHDQFSIIMFRNIRIREIGR